MRSFEVTVICINGNACTYWVMSDSVAGALNVAMKPVKAFENDLDSKVVSVKIKERGVSDEVRKEQGDIQTGNAES